MIRYFVCSIKRIYSFSGQRFVHTDGGWVLRCECGKHKDEPVPDIVVQGLQQRLEARRQKS